MPRKIVDTILPTTMVGSYPRPHWFDSAAARPRRAGRVQGRRPRRGVRRCHPRGHPRSGGGRPRHRHRRPDVLRRLRRRDRLVLLVHVRADRRLRPGQGGAPARSRGRRDARTRVDACSPTGAASSTAARSRTARSAWSTCTRSPRATRQADQGLGRRRPGQPGLARLLPALQGPAGALLRAGADLQRRDEGPRRGRRDLPPARGSRRLAAAVHRRRGRLQVDRAT